MSRLCREQVWVVTGATRGIGRALAVAAGARGARVVLVGRSTGLEPNRLLPGSLEEVSAQIDVGPGVAHAVRADLAVEGDRDRVVEQTLARFGRCDVLVNNAAYIPSGLGLSVPLRRWARAIEVNYLAAVHLMTAFGAGMCERGHGQVVNVGSQAAVREVRGQVAYGASKAALERLSVGMASELSEHGMQITCIRVDEPVTTDLWHWTKDSGVLESLGSEADTGRDVAESTLYTPADFAAAVVAMLGSLGPTEPVLGFADLRRHGWLADKSGVSGVEGSAGLTEKG